MFKRYVILLALVLMSWVQASNIGISPSRIELKGRPGQTITETIIVLADTVNEQQIQVRVGDWTLKPDGELVILDPNVLAESASSWIEPEEDVFSLVGKTNKEFRISVTIPDDASLAGTYHSLVFFSVVPAATETPGVAVITTTEIGMAVYVTIVETEETSAELLDFYQADDRELSLAILNDGNSLMRLGGRIELRNEAGLTEHSLEIPALPVLRESERELTVAIPDEVKSGFYVALAFVEDSRGGLLVGELALEIP